MLLNHVDGFYGLNSFGLLAIGYGRGLAHSSRGLEQQRTPTAPGPLIQSMLLMSAQTLAVIF